MEHEVFLSITGVFILLLLGIIGWFLIRLVKQQDEAHQSNKDQFKELLTKFDILNITMIEHKTDVEVIKEQISNHAIRLGDMNMLYDRVRTVENEISSIKARSH